MGSVASVDEPRGGAHGDAGVKRRVLATTGTHAWTNQGRFGGVEGNAWQAAADGSDGPGKSGRVGRQGGT